MANVPELLYVLLKPHIAELTAVINPGLVTLTWTSMNISAFLQRFHSEMLRFNELVDKLKDIMANRLMRNQQMIAMMPQGMQVQGGQGLLNGHWMGSGPPSPSHLQQQVRRLVSRLALTPPCAPEPPPRTRALVCRLISLCHARDFLIGPSLAHRCFFLRWSACRSGVRVWATGPCRRREETA
jgi:hypothetical protein